MKKVLQYISYKKKKETLENVVFSDFKKPQSLDAFDINIIDLNDDQIWCSNSPAISDVNCKNDLLSIRKMIENTTVTNVLLLLPSNQPFKYHYGRRPPSYSEGYLETIELKDKIDIICDVVLKCILPEWVYAFDEIFYENTTTTIGNESIPASFCFKKDLGDNAATISEKSKKVTTVWGSERILVSSLCFSDFNKAVSFANCMFSSEYSEDAPEWISIVEFWSDAEQKDIVKKNESEIEQCRLRINEANERLCMNNRYKSILYTSGDQLVEVVFDILQQILDCDLSDFVDKKREDFVIKKEDVTFVGEIKGINTNVKNENISQVQRHWAVYTDDLQDKDQTENVKQILIINPFRKKPLSDREPIHDDQLKLAVRNECVVVRTEVLLRVYEAFEQSSISVEEIEKAFAECNGDFSLENLLKR